MNHETLKHAAVWAGSHLTECQEWQHVLGPEEQKELTDAARVIADAESGLRTQGLPTPLAPVNWPLPHLGKRLDRIQTQLEHGTGAIRIRGFPVGGLPNQTCQALFRMFSSRLGTPVSQSAEGDEIFSVRDAGFAESDPRSRGPNTSRELSFHTDRADVTGFLCLRQAKAGGENEIASSMAVYNEVLKRRPDLIHVLMEPLYYQRHTVDLGNRQPWCQQPVFSFADGHFACCFLRILIERAHRDPGLPDLSSRQRFALDLLESIAGEPEMHHRFRQEPGDLIFINNWVVLHRRTGFVDHAEPDLKRNILRVWLSMPNSRPIDPLFRENWGAVEAGALRGGMRAAAVSR